MDWIPLILFLAEGYFLGSIPSAVWIGIFLFGKDVRQHGSGNAGATNTFRVLGKPAGIIVLSLDILKGFLAVKIPYMLGIGFGYPGGVEDFSIVCGIMAVLGHLYPAFAGFKGGKGVATALGIMLAAAPLAILPSVAVFLMVWLLSSYVSLASISAAVCFPLILFIFFKPDGLVLSITALIVPLLIVYTHRTNLVKLLKGTENKTPAFKKRG